MIEILCNLIIFAVKANAVRRINRQSRAVSGLARISDDEGQAR
jgi:hypothetical protein